MIFTPNAIATAVGSFPHESVEDASQLIFETTPHIPVWPQLPKKDFFEEITNQYSRSLPCYYIDHKNRKYGFDTEEDLPGQLEAFYRRVIDEDLDYFGLDDEHSAGFGFFLDTIKKRKGDEIAAIKGQVIGPLTHGLIPDKKDGKYAIYHSDLFDVIVKNSTMNSRWQIQKMREVFPRVIIFIDEPSLSIIGSGYYSVDHNLIIDSFNEIIKGIRKEGGIPGMHCCGDADWEEVLNLDLDIINFDATDEVILDKFLQSRNLNSFLEQGKVVAWGIIPTIHEKIEGATIEQIEKNFTAVIKQLASRGVREEDVLSSAIITPSCGTGTLTVPLAEKALRLTRDLSNHLRG